MLIYGYKGKKCLINGSFWYDNKNGWALYNYDYDLMRKYLNSNDGTTLVRHVYNSYTTLCKFNNSLVSTYEVNNNYINSIEFVRNYLDKNEDIENSMDRRCRSIYDHLKVWYRRLCNNPNSLDDIKWQVAKTMKHYEKQEIFRKASINLKRNYQDFVV